LRPPYPNRLLQAISVFRLDSLSLVVALCAELQLEFLFELVHTRYFHRVTREYSFENDVRSFRCMKSPTENETKKEETFALGQ
jgi:hypothetical protein